MATTILEPISGYYFEDLEVGQVMRSKRLTISEDSIIAYGLTWDPQPFHIDRVAAAESVFGGLVASGLQTLNVTYRLYFDSGFLRGSVVAGVAIENIGFPYPVRPGDTLQVDMAIIEKANAAKKGRGRVRLQLNTLNQDERLVMHAELVILIACKQPIPKSV